jgi:acyl carrier protein
MTTVVRSILAQHARLAKPVTQLHDHDNLHAAGLDSMAMVNVMLALEEALGIEIPEALMTRQAFSSINALSALVQRLTPVTAGAARPAFTAARGG